MSSENVYPVAMDKFYRLPPKVREILAESPELQVLGGTPDEAGLNTVGFLKAVFIENEGTIPPEAVSPYILVIEQA